MGYIKHNTAIVANWDKEKLHSAHQKAKEIYRERFSNNLIIKDASPLVSDIIEGIANSQYTFFIAPDGSKEGWMASNLSDEARKEFLDWIIESGNLSDYIEVRFGGGDEYSGIVRTKRSDLDNLK